MAVADKRRFPGDPLYLMDGMAFIFRGFYAYQNMSRSDGMPTNALFIVTRLILKLLREEKPERFLFIMDGKGPHFRHELFPAYKAQRGSAPEGLILQLDSIRRMIDALGLPVLVSENCEADDCIASIAARFKAEHKVVIIGADKDLKQCLDDNVLLWDPGAKEEKCVSLADFRQAEGMEPSSWPDYQALIGDASDNIPGVPGIGPKTASELFHYFSSLEEIRDHFAAVPPKIAKKLQGHLDEAFLYRKLTTLRRDCCPSVTDEFSRVHAVNWDAALALMKEFELHSLARELASMQRITFTGPERVAPSSPSLPEVSPAPPASVNPPPDTQKARPKIPPANTGSAEQISLFAVDAAPRLPEMAVFSSSCASPDALPDYGGTLLSVVRLAENAGVLLSTGEASILFTGAEAALAGKICDAPPERVVTPDLKALYAADGTWKKLPVERCFDLSLAAYLLNPEERDYSWAHLMRRHAQETADAAGQVAGQVIDQGRFALHLHALFASRLSVAEGMDLMQEMEMPLIPVLKDMEEVGICIDRNAFAAFLGEIRTELARLEKTIHDLAGIPFNIRSSQQMGDVLFTRLGLPKVGKTKGGGASTSQESLEKLAGKHPVVDAILEFRTLEKLRSTYLEPLPRLADEAGRFHTHFNLLTTATGRLSSSNPNLQNIPIRGSFGPRMRACFIAAEGHRLVSADYSQVELRILAYLARDPILTDSFRKGEDIHRRTASLLFDVDADKVTADMRRHAKTIIFGLIYGMGAQKLGQDLGISVKEAKGFITRYFERLGALRVFYDAIEQSARGQGYVTTISGRRRYMPDILSNNKMLQSQARRQAINARVQGSAADIIKMAMLAVSRDCALRAFGAELLLQIHDELVMEVPADNAAQAGERLARIMEDACPAMKEGGVPLVAEWGVGENWNEAH
ncbi:hypothetical protein FACS1894206_07980 [Deltaproteobacteria bacterium]|nr:hypothetical protein FACS1894206_07980 [Deltaproteobacteria bacterium]